VRQLGGSGGLEGEEGRGTHSALSCLGLFFSRVERRMEPSAGWSAMLSEVGDGDEEARREAKVGGGEGGPGEAEGGL